VINILYDVIVLESFFTTHDCVTMTMICDRCVTVICDITLTPNSKTKIRKLNRKEIKINRVYHF